jgi:hypothetical protein
MEVVKKEKQIKEVEVTVERYTLCDKCNEKIMNDLNKLLDDILENHVKILRTNDHSGMTQEYDSYDAINIINSILKSSLMGNLLHLFWQRSSDACPLECGEAEKQELMFKEWVNKLTYNDLFNKLNLNIPFKNRELSEFELAVTPAIRYLLKKHNPHTKICINYSVAELLSGEMTVNKNDEVPD